jgi:hypothetical protein
MKVGNPQFACCLACCAGIRVDFHAICLPHYSTVSNSAKLSPRHLFLCAQHYKATQFHTMADRHGTSVFCLFHSLMEPTLVPCLSAKLRVLLSRNLPRDGCLALSAWIWWHPSFLLEFGEVFFLRTGICDRIIPFQKTVSPFDDFLPPKQMTGPPPHRAVAGRERECMRASFLLWFACTCELDWKLLDH